MSTIFPIRRAVEHDEQRGPRLVDIDEDVADEVFAALSSETTRQVFRELHDAPRTASDLAEATETSVQNAQYHLGKLVDADLVEVVDTWYSERGTEMKVYAPTDESLVLFAGRDDGGRLRELLERVAVVLPVLGVVSALVAWLARRTVEWGGRQVEPVSPGALGAAADGAAETAASATGLDPAAVAGIAFFLGGTVALALVVATRYWRH